jgi:hypothetical protein
MRYNELIIVLLPLLWWHIEGRRCQEAIQCLTWILGGYRYPQRHRYLRFAGAHIRVAARAWEVGVATHFVMATEFAGLQLSG